MGCWKLLQNRLPRFDLVCFFFCFFFFSFVFFLKRTLLCCFSGRSYTARTMMTDFHLHVITLSVCLSMRLYWVHQRFRYKWITECNVKRDYNQRTSKLPRNQREAGGLFLCVHIPVVLTEQWWGIDGWFSIGLKPWSCFLFMPIIPFFPKTIFKFKVTNFDLIVVWPTPLSADGQTFTNY